MIIRRINSTRESRMMRVAAYARVSTIKEEQEESFETQLRYYEYVARRLTVASLRIDTRVAED